MARIDYSNVSIPLQQFEAVASGKYNAGEVKLTGQHSLDRVNNHVHFTRLNNVVISHAEVVAIKNAFVRALSEGGVNDEEIGKIRAQLGLAPSGAVDAKLDERSMKPLTRQQIRDILDRYAAVLHVRTSNEIKADVPLATRQERATTRRTVNDNLDANRAMESNAALVTFQRVLADDVDFYGSADYAPMLAEAKRQLEALYAGCGDDPSAERQAKARCALPGGQTVEIDTGMSEVAYAEKLFQTIARLEYMDIYMHRRLDYRNEYQNLDHNARVTWIDNVSNRPDALVLARTAAVLALQEKGITDYEALSIVNKITLGSVVDLLSNLEDPQHHENWDMSRDHIVAVMRQYPPHEDGNSGCVYIPATSPSQYNKALRTFFKNLSGSTPPAPPGFKQFAHGVLADLRTRFGEGVVPAGEKLDRYISANKLNRMLQIEGAGDYAQNVARARLDDLRGPFTEMARTACAQRAVFLFAGSVAKEINVKVVNDQMVVNALTGRHPELIGRLVQCENPGQTAEVLGAVRADAEKAVRRCAILDRYRHRGDFHKLVREELSGMTGIPVSSLEGEALPERRLRVMAIRFSDKINSGEVQADTEEEILAKFREEARTFAEERAGILAKVDGLPVTDATKSELKTWILAQEKVSFIDFDAILGKMENINDKVWRLSEALKNMRMKDKSATSKDRDKVYEAMNNLSEEVDVLRDEQFEGKNVNADIPEKQALGTLIAMLAIGGFVGIRDDIALFLARTDVSHEMEAHWENRDHISVEAYNYLRYAAPNVAEANAAIADSIASGSPNAMSGQAIVQGCREAGLTAIKPDEAIALFTTGKMLAGELRSAIDGLPAVATPQMIRTIVSAVLRRHAAQIQNGRPLPVLLATPAERKTAIINKIAGGTGVVAQRARQMLETKLGPDPQNPEAKTYGEIVRNVRTLLLQGLLHDLKSIANGEKGMYLGSDFNRSIVKLAGIGKVVANTADEAANVFARFVTGRADATYAGLAPKEKLKADLAMAMAAQTSLNSLLGGFAIMMHPNGSDPGFTPSGSWQDGIRDITIENGQNGDLKVSILGEFEPKMVVFQDGEAVKCNPGSRMKFTADFTFTASELNRISKVDFSKYDGTAIKNRLDVEKPKDKCEGAIDLIPMDFRINTGMQIDVEGEFR